MGKKSFSKRRELLRGKPDRNLKKEIIKNMDMEHHTIWIRDMDHEKRRYNKTGGL